MIETDMTGAMSNAVKEKVVENIPFKEMGKPEDIAETVAFLAGDGARYITGQSTLCRRRNGKYEKSCNNRYGSSYSCRGNNVNDM